MTRTSASTCSLSQSRSRARISCCAHDALHWLLAVVVGCSHHTPATAPASTAPATASTAPAAAAAPGAIDAAHAEAIVNAADRDDRDKKHDAQRKPAELLVFAGVAPGMHAADLGAGTGYTSELVARAVGPTGSVIAQDSPHWDGPWLLKAWKPRLRRRRWRTRST